MSVFKATEMTVRGLLQKELEKRGVRVVPELSFVTPVGRMMPDLVLKNLGDYVVETKLGAEAKLFDALIQLYDYSKYTEAKGAFAILFPEELRRPWPYEILEKISADPKLSYKVAALFKDLRPTQQFAGNLSQITDWIAGHVLRPPVVEADTSLAVRVLSEAVDFVTASMRQLGDKELEDIFGGKTVFENILQYEKGKYPLEEMRKAAVYLLINQILFYHVLSNVDKYYVPMDETKIKTPGDLAEYFRRVLEKDYSSTFGFDVASRLPDDATEIIKKTVMVIKALAPQKIGQDVLGKVFHELIPFEIRKAVAAFYTNNEAAEILAQLAIDDPNAKVMDLAVGSGTLLVASYRRKKELLKKAVGAFNFEDHKRFLEEDLTGIDVMPFAAHLAVVHLSLQALIFETEKVRIAVWDSTELKPGQVIPAISRELKAAYKRPTLEMFLEGKPSFEEGYIKKGSVTFEGVGGERIPLEQVDVIIMNPPFTRERLMPKAYKLQLATRFREYNKYLHGQLGLYGYFMFLADKFLKTNGRLALVLPTSLLRIPAAEELRKFLTQHYIIEYVITTWQRSAFSESARFREMLLVAKKAEGNVPVNSRCGLVALKKLPTVVEEARRYADKIKTVISKLEIGNVHDDEMINAQVVTQTTLKQHVKNIFSLLSVSDLKEIEILEEAFAKGSKKITNLKSHLGKMHGEYSRFDTWFKGYKLHELFICDTSRAIKNIDRWIIKQVRKNELVAENRFTHARICIPLKATTFGFRRPAGTGFIDLSDRLDYIVTEPFQQIDKILENRNSSQVIGVLSDWKRFVEKRLSNMLLIQDVNISAPGTKLIAYYSPTPATGEHMWNFSGITDEMAKVWVLWFNSIIYLLWVVINRVEVEGAWIKFHSYLVNESPILNVQKLTENDKMLLLKTFENVKNENFPSILQQLKTQFSGRVQIDRAVLQVLGFSKGEVKRILDYLYPALVKEIEQLKTLMQG